jgi:hypothetical protein
MEDDVAFWIGAASCALLALAIVHAWLTPGRRAAKAQIALLLLCLAASAALLLRHRANTGDGDETRPSWHQLGVGITEGISGLAVVEHSARETILLAVHDNKEPGQKRLSLVVRDALGRVSTRQVSWKGEPLAVDLEAICRVPGDQSFVALTSRGALFRLQVNVAAGEATFASEPAGVPNAAEERQFEALDMQLVNGLPIVCWAERGDNATPATIFCSSVDTATLTFAEPQALEVKAPWPTEHTRHISDLRILPSGTVLAASASDPGNARPFTGAIYAAASVALGPDRLTLLAADPPTRLFTTSRKIEALELLPGAAGGMVLGSDDENLGAAVLFGW